MLPGHIGLPATAWCDRPLGAALAQIGLRARFAEVYSAFDHSLLEPRNQRAALASGLRLTVHGPWEGAEIGVPDEAARRRGVELHRRHVEAAAAVGAETYVVHPDYSVTPRPRDARVRAALERSVADLEQVQRETGVRVTLENLGGREHTHFAAPGDLGLGALGLTLDTGHAAAGGDLAAFLSRRNDGLVHVHLHDNPGGDARDDPHLPLGRGVVDAAAVLALAREAQATVILELLMPGDVDASIAYLVAEGLAEER